MKGTSCRTLPIRVSEELPCVIDILQLDMVIAQDSEDDSARHVSRFHGVSRVNERIHQVKIVRSLQIKT
jgi:hypothetical protein